jgi:hypothetical protein
MIVLYVLSLKHKDDIFTGIDTKKHKLYFLYPMAKLLLTKTGIEKKLLNNTAITKKIRSLYTSDHNDYQAKLYWYQKSSLLLLVIFAFSCISMMISLTTISSHTFQNNIVRPKEGEGDSHLTLRFRMENEYDKGDIYENEITIHNKERKYTEEEWEEILNKAIPYLEQELLGQNEALEYVDKDLNFIRSIPDTSIAVEWIPKDYRLISASGKLLIEDTDEEGTDTQITAILKCGDKRQEHTIPLTIYPAKLDKEAFLYQELSDALNRADKESSTMRQWQLPGKAGEYLITWRMPDSNTAFQIFITGLMGSVLLWFLMDKALDDKIKIRNNQLLLDYPEIIYKFNLLVNAGMTIKQVWNKISEDYKLSKRLGNRQTRYAYEEMLVTLHELKLGLPEATAYEHFGQRVGLMPYMKFSSLLVQNLKKGNRDMIDILKQEAKEALHERKETTKRLGEEASTKLLGPMIIMLLIVMAIILVPAFISFQI